MFWLLDKTTEDAMIKAVAAGIHPTAEQQLELEARSYSAASGELPRIMTTAGDRAEIRIEGVLTKNPNWMAMLFGGGNTTYSEIIGAIAAAEQDPAITETIMRVGSSPGGSIDGLFGAIAAIQSAKKPIHAIVEESANSATFGLITQADTITAENKATRFGSVGVVVDARVDDSVVSITNTESPKKRPDLETKEGQAVVREELDAIHELFADAIATGRGTDVKDVNANFGQGATLLAEEAQKRGMIDGIADGPQVAIKKAPAAAASRGNKKEKKAMDLATLKAEHSALYMAVVQEGIDQGVAAEKDRTGEFLVAGEMSGDMKTALEGIKTGSAMTGTLRTTFMMAAANRGSTAARSDDDGAAAAALDGAAAASEADQEATANQALTAATFEACGVEMEVK